MHLDLNDMDYQMRGLLLYHSMGLGKSMEAIAQRITIRTQFTGIEHDEIQKYIQHHLAIAGRTDNIFSDNVIADIYQHARGIPRLINTLCYECLLEIYIQNKNVVDGPILQKVLVNYELA